MDIIPAKKPRKADVARWVATLTSTVTYPFDRESRKADARDRERAKGQLASWGLKVDGMPIEEKNLTTCEP